VNECHIYSKGRSSRFIMQLILSSLKKNTIIALACVAMAIPSLAFAGAPQRGATLSIPEIDVQTRIIPLYVDESIGTWDTEPLNNLIGHFEYTAWLGETGNMVLGGHSTLENGAPGIFSNLDELAIGDEITVTQGGITQTYQVTSSQYVGLTDLSVVYPTEADILTLMTCAGFNRASGEFEQRLVVVAQRVE
jgi:LPXTG-site transpeptidase (sortase) family protein